MNDVGSFENVSIVDTSGRMAYCGANGSARYAGARPAFYLDKSTALNHGMREQYIKVRN